MDEIRSPGDYTPGLFGRRILSTGKKRRPSSRDTTRTDSSMTIDSETESVLTESTFMSEFPSCSELRSLHSRNSASVCSVSSESNTSSCTPIHVTRASGFMTPITEKSFEDSWQAVRDDSRYVTELGEDIYAASPIPGFASTTVPGVSFETESTTSTDDVTLNGSVAIPQQIVIRRSGSVSMFSSGGRWPVCQFLNDCVFVLSKFPHNLKCIDVDTFELIQELKLDSDVMPHSFCVHNDQIAMTFPYAKRIVLYGVKNLEQEGELNTSEKIFGITRIWSGWVVTDHSVRLLNDRGMTIHVANVELSSPDFITTNKQQSKIFLTDTGSNSIICLNDNLDCLWTFNNRRLISPRGLCVIEDGNLLVAGWLSNNIMELTSDGQVVRSAIAKDCGDANVRFPWDVSYGHVSQTLSISEYGSHGFVKLYSYFRSKETAL